MTSVHWLEVGDEVDCRQDAQESDIVYRASGEASGDGQCLSL